MRDRVGIDFKNDQEAIEHCKELAQHFRDGTQYITKLPKAEHDVDEWLAAMDVLLQVAELDGSPMFAWMGGDASVEPPRRTRV